MNPRQQPEHELGTAMVGQRDRLIRLCTALTGDSSIADDLTAEIFYEAWRNRHKLYDVNGLAPWLSAIARNVCRRWLRKQGVNRTTDISLDADVNGLESEDWELAFEREELASLLDQALALLPSDTHDILINQIIYGFSHAEIADHLGLPVEVIAMRLSRGKARLRKLLLTQFSDQVIDFGLVDAANIGWEAIHIWCPTCGQHHLQARFDRPDGQLSFRCPLCSRHFAANHTNTSLMNRHFKQLLSPLKRYKTAWNRLADWTHHYYRQGLTDKIACCTNCGDLNTVLLRHTEQGENAGLMVHCEACGEICTVSHTGLLLALPVVCDFWRDYPRMRTQLPIPTVIAGRQALVTSFQSVTHHAALEVISAADNFELLEVHYNPESIRPC